METKTNNSNQRNSKETNEYELVKIEKTKKVCGLCESFASSKSENPDLIAVISCEGACLRGEVSRHAANKICFDLLPQNTARVCLGSAFTKDSGQRHMVKNANRVIALEGCVISCASRMMKGVIPGLDPEIIYVDRYYDFNKNLFAINEATDEEIDNFSKQASKNILKLIEKEIENTAA